MPVAPAPRTEPIRVGVVGAGMIAQLGHIPFYGGDGCSRLVALADSRSELVRQIAGRFEIPQVFDDASDLFARSDVDAVVVILPRKALGPAVLEALEAGKHVLSEKPMAHTLDQARRLVKAAGEQQRTYAVGFMKRHDPGVRVGREKLRELRASGALGELVHVRCHDFCLEYAADLPDFVRYREKRPTRLAEWPGSPDWLPPDRGEAYAWFVNVAVHDINLLRYLLECPLIPVASRSQSDKSHTVIFDADGTTVVLEAGRSAAGSWRQGVELFFRRGRMTIDLSSPMQRGGVAAVVIERNDGEPRREALKPRGGWAFAEQAHAFIDDVCQGRTPVAGGADSMEDLVVMEQIWKLEVEVR